VANSFTYLHLFAEFSNDLLSYLFKKIGDFMDIEILIAISASTFTIIAVIISLFLWLCSEGNSDRRNLYDIQREDRKDLLQITRNIENVITAIQQEMKDFHGRLERTDAEFKGKMALQDAEFKAHLMHFHGKEEVNK
jgi:hypothetical protein